MLSWLFGTDELVDMLATPTFWYTMALLVGVVVLLVYCLKNPTIGKWVFLGIFCVAWIGLSAYSGIQLNYYYSSTGGIYGQITGMFNPNEVEVKENLTFEFKNIELTESADNTYSAIINLNEILSVSNDDIGVYVNDMPCTYVEHNSDYVVARYKYIFLDEDMTELCTDTLAMRFAFYENSTRLTVSTTGGATAVQYWNYYFNNNNFVVRIGKSGYDYSSDVELGNGDISNYSVVTYYYKDETYLIQTYKNGEKINLPSVDDYRFQYWTLNGDRISSDYYVTENITLVANVLDEYVVTLIVNDDEFDKPYSTTSFLSNEIIELTEPTDPSPNDGSHWVFDGYSLDGISEISLDEITLVEDITIYALFHYEYDVTIFFDSLGTTQQVKQGENVVVPSTPEYFVLSGFSIDNETIDISTYVVTKPVLIHAIGYYEYPVKFMVNDSVYYSTNVERLDAPTLPTNPSVSGQVFLGWSKEGHTIIEDMSSETITAPTTYYAVFSVEEFTLTIQDSYNSTSIMTTENGTTGSTITLTPPTLEGHNFIEWRIKSGQGSINGNEFTFSSSDCVVYAVFDYATCFIRSDLSFDLTYNDTTETINVSGMVFASASTTIETNNSDTIVIKSKAVNSSTPEITTDGEYSVSGTHETGYTITFTNCSYISIYMFASNTTYT